MSDWGGARHDSRRGFDQDHEKRNQFTRRHNIMTDYLLIGSGSHALALLEALRSNAMPPPRAVIDFEEDRHGMLVGPHRIVGGRDMIASLLAAGCHLFLNGVGDQGDIEPRRHAHAVALESGLRPMIVFDRSATIAPSARLAAGAQIMAGAIVGAECELHENALISAGAILQPRANVGADSHMAPGTKLLDGASVGQRSHIGAGAIVLPRVAIGDDCSVAPGLVIQDSMPSGSTAVGSAARVITQQGWRMAG